MTDQCAYEKIDENSLRHIRKEIFCAGALLAELRAQNKNRDVQEYAAMIADCLNQIRYHVESGIYERVEHEITPFDVF